MGQIPQTTNRATARSTASLALLERVISGVRPNTMQYVMEDDFWQTTRSLETEVKLVSSVEQGHMFGLGSGTGPDTSE
ncbi:hypothetical protein CSPX01_11051 [Colletotrichum filicis]|nr:hypothetical protein CSPX01_11051 [Colletotrichum filicis]